MAREIVRFDLVERASHWSVALFFILAGLSGLSLFHPSLVFFNNMYGGGQWTRILHPYLGLLMIVAFVPLFLRFRPWNRFDATDREWARHVPHLIMTSDEHGMPPVGKFNPGQKLVYWVASLCLLVLLVTGFVFWRPWFAPYFPVWALRVATLLHSAAGALLVLMIIIHVYSSIWVKGSQRAMIRGTVSDAWARQNHPLWHRQMRGDR